MKPAKVGEGFLELVELLAAQLNFVAQVRKLSVKEIEAIMNALEFVEDQAAQSLQIGFRHSQDILAH